MSNANANSIMPEFCSFVLIQEDGDRLKYKCSKCTHILTMPKTISEPPLIPCRKDLNEQVRQQRSPNLFKKIMNFIKASYRHIITGGKRTSPIERNRRLSICKSCEMFDGRACMKCGCPITAHAKFISKLDWASQHCPLKKW